MDLQAEISPELWASISKTYTADMYSAAVLGTINYLREVIREKANVETDGVDLMRDAFDSINNQPPRILINSYQSENDKSEQRGFALVMRGVWGWIRNIRTHESYEDTKQAADVIIVFIDYLISIVGRSKTFEFEGWVATLVSDRTPDDQQSAKLLAEKVPQKKIARAMIAVYRSGLVGGTKKLRNVLEALTTRANKFQISELLSAVSDDILAAQGDAALSRPLQLLPDTFWKELTEEAHLHLEYALSESLMEGETRIRDEFLSDAGVLSEVHEVVDAFPTGTVTLRGGLGSWVTKFIEHLSSEYRRRVLDSLISNTESKVGKQRMYAATVAILIVGYLDGEECKTLQKAICSKVLDDEHEQDCYVVRFYYDSLPRSWQESVASTLRCSVLETKEKLDDVLRRYKEERERKYKQELDEDAPRNIYGEDQ